MLHYRRMETKPSHPDPKPRSPGHHLQSAAHRRRARGLLLGLRRQETVLGKNVLKGAFVGLMAPSVQDMYLAVIYICIYIYIYLCMCRCVYMFKLSYS